eukprot:Protomagalhaensia_wolfi_Nauph_80__5741@NODE_696_length_2102_cov_1080_915657_g520_i0_p3_GENE_NODE_696_length_2102_cov_1080_915657_g520_i0NODE_696_length_2102_cov_1080_915657_g520_i0_p3_ORF_typecomplete_len132_score13_65_NODE_696_length_2102_cov_1080_915657_g520_i011131508
MRKFVLLLWLSGWRSCGESVSEFLGEGSMVLEEDQSSAMSFVLEASTTTEMHIVGTDVCDAVNCALREDCDDCYRSPTCCHWYTPAQCCNFDRPCAGNMVLPSQCGALSNSTLSPQQWILFLVFLISYHFS